MYKSIRADLPQAVPAWPLGLPAWEDPWIALALHTPATTYLTVWRRPGADDTAVLRLPRLRGADVSTDLLYPSSGRPHCAWDQDAAELTVTLPAAPSAVLLRLRQPARPPQTS